MRHLAGATRDGAPCELKGSRTVRGGGKEHPTGCAEDDSYLSPLFASEDTKDILLSFLNATLKPNTGEELADVTLLDRELDPKRIKDRALRLDILAKTTSGETIDLEVQVANERNIDRRTLFHWARLYYTQISQGGEFKDLHRTIAIDVLDFDWFTGDGRYHHVFHVREDESADILCNHLELHFLEIRKFKKLKRPPENTLERWLIYLGNARSEKMNAIADKESAIRKALTVEEIFWQDETERRYYQMRRDGLLDYRSEMSALREEGFKDGEKKGIEKGRRETARAALRKGYPIDDIIDITGLSRETVLSLKDEVDRERLAGTISP
jgi:predicted transposase/invertase (TIGR01784 family)